MNDITPENIIGRDNPLGTYLADLERPGGILERDLAEVGLSIQAIGCNLDERVELVDLVEKLAEVHEVFGSTMSDIQSIEVLRGILGDANLHQEHYDLLWERAEYLRPRLDESPDGQLFVTWKRFWDRLREVTYSETDHYRVNIAAVGYAQARENWGHNMASLAFQQMLRTPTDEEI